MNTNKDVLFGVSLVVGTVSAVKLVDLTANAEYSMLIPALGMMLYITGICTGVANER